jgi:putative hydrolase of the HAD superfamily
MPAPKAVLLDVGGIFHLPAHDRIVAAFARADVTIPADVLDRAHYAGAAQFTVHYEGELDWKLRWRAYLDGYMTACGVGDDPSIREEVHTHLDSEFAVGDLWSRIVPGSVDGLRALVATGVHVGIISNADGTVAQRLAAQEVLQVGPGIGVDVECVIDSGAVGVSKPDPKIFHLALDAIGVAAADSWYVGDMPGIDVVGARAAGLRPIVMDPFGYNEGADFARVSSLREVADMVSAS